MTTNLTGLRGAPVHTPVTREAPKAPDTAALAQAGAGALQRMRPAEREVVMAGLEATPGHIAQSAALTGASLGAGLSGRLLSVKAQEIEHRILKGQFNGVVGDTADRVADLKDALVDGKLRAAAGALAQMAQKAGASEEAFTGLVRRMEILADLQGKGDLRMVSDPGLKSRVYAFTNGNLGELAKQVANELGRLAFAPVAQETRKAGVQ